MENLNTTAVVEKVARIALPEITTEQYVALDYKGSNIPGAEVAIIQVNDIAEYAQVAAIVKTCTNVLYSSGNKTCTIVVDGSLERNVNQVALLNPELKGKVVAIHINYNGAEKLRLSAKTTGTAKAKKTAKSAFFDLDLANVIDYEGANYVYGKEGSEFSRETNTKIARVVKALLPYGVLYSDEDKSGFNKGQTKIPVDVRVKEENYIFFFNFDEIKSKLQLDVVTKRIAANLIAKATPKGGTISDEVVANLNADAAKIAAELNINADTVIADIIAIINFYYPTLVVDTTKELILECSKSIFASLKSERLAFDAATKTVISLTAEKDRLDAEKKAAKEVAKAAADAEKKANKAKKVEEDAKEEEVKVDLGIANTQVNLAPLGEAVNAGIVVPTPTEATIVTPAKVDPTALLNAIVPPIA